jgi:hypothetical protein
MLTMFLSAVLSEACWTGACPVYLARWFPQSVDRDSRQTALPGFVRSCSGSALRPMGHAGAVRTASFFVHLSDGSFAGDPVPGDWIDPGHARRIIAGFRRMHHLPMITTSPGSVARIGSSYPPDVGPSGPMVPIPERIPL